jgi:hypothetical protein
MITESEMFPSLIGTFHWPSQVINRKDKVSENQSLQLFDKSQVPVIKTEVDKSLTIFYF